MKEIKMKKNYVLVTDSNSELPLQFAKEHNVDFVPMPYILGDDETPYYLGEHTDFKDFYAKMRSGMMPQTSTYPPQYYIDKLTPYLEDDKDILFISFSSQLSSAFNYITVAREHLIKLFPNRKIYLVDTSRISVPMALLVIDSVCKKNDGMDIEALAKWVEENKLNYRVYFMVNDINHLKRGGRISPAVAAVGTMLSIKPILNINDEGKIVKYGSEKGRKKAINKLAALVNEDITVSKNSKIIIGHADSIDDATLLKNEVLKKGTETEIIIQNIGPVLGTHCGPGTLAIGYKRDKA